MIKPVDLEKAMPVALLAFPAVVDQVVRDLGEECRNEIVRHAMLELHTTADDYIAGLQPVEYTLGSRGDSFSQTSGFEISLVGALPNMIEKGWDGGDMKETLLSGRNAKVGKNGSRYNTVPFRHMGPNASGRNGAPMGSAYKASRGETEAEEIGKRVYAAAKKLKQGMSLQAGLAPLLQSHHKTDIYAGMIKQQQAYTSASGKVTNQSQYKTFRRVSDNSDPDSWLHPGIKPHHLFDDAVAYIERSAPSAFARAWLALVRGSR